MIECIICMFFTALLMLILIIVQRKENKVQYLTHLR